MEDNIIDAIQRKIWTVEDLTSQAKKLTTKANQLPKGAKKNIPVFSGEWSEDSVKKFFEKFKESIRNPLRHKNRKLLEDIGIQAKGLSEEIFDDSTGIEEVVGVFDALKKFNETITSILIEKEILFGWLREGIARAKENLQEILDAKMAFQRIFNSGINGDIRDELLQKSIADRRFITSAEDILSKVKFVIGYGISTTGYKETFDTFQSNLENVCQKVENLQDEYKIPKDEISAIANGKTLQEADELLKKKLEECSEKKGRLLEEWKMYSACLKSIGQEVPELPQGLQQLGYEVEKLNRECISALGREGLGILQFLKGEGKFPDKISKDGIKKALEILRPLFVKFLREGD